jgi:hypothetical protein
MNMELGVDSKPKEHPNARICRQLALPQLVAPTSSRIAVDDKLWQRLLPVIAKRLARRIFTGDTMLHWRDRWAR